MKRETFECSLCGAELEKKKIPMDIFFGYSNYKTTGCKFTRKIQEKSGEKKKDLT